MRYGPNPYTICITNIPKGLVTQDKGDTHVFKRRKNKTLADDFRNAIWPDMGWLRLFRYYGLRIYRLNDTPSSVAIGIACGISMSFTPFIGLHLLLSAGLAKILGGSILAAMIGTLVGNPWTFPFVWYLIYKIGMFILGVDTVEALPNGFTLTSFFEDPSAFFIPMLVGSIPCAIGTWILSFYPTRTIVARFQRRRRKRRIKAALKRIKRQEKALAKAAKAEINDMNEVSK